MATYKTNIHHIDRRNTIQCIATISPIQWITILPHMQIITMHALGGDCTIHIKFFTYYAGIMLDAFLYLLCSKLCWHNWRRPTVGRFISRGRILLYPQNLNYENFQTFYILMEFIGLILENYPQKFLLSNPRIFPPLKLICYTVFIPWYEFSVNECSIRV